MFPSWHFIFGFLGQSKIHAERSLDNELNTANTIITNATGNRHRLWLLRTQRRKAGAAAAPLPRPQPAQTSAEVGWQVDRALFPSKRAEIPAHAPKPMWGRFQHWPGLNWVGYFYSCIPVTVQEAQESPHSLHPWFACSFHTVPTIRERSGTAPEQWEATHSGHSEIQMFRGNTWIWTNLKVQIPAWPMGHGDTTTSCPDSSPTVP